MDHFLGSAGSLECWEKWVNMENSEKDLQKYANEAAVPLEKISTKTKEDSGEIPDCCVQLSHGLRAI